MIVYDNNFIAEHEGNFYSFRLMTDLEKYVQDKNIKSFRLIVTERTDLNMVYQTHRIILNKIVNR